MPQTGAGATAGPRDAPVDAERLWRVVEDPAAPEEARVGAAVALGDGLDAEGRARLRVVAGGTAGPRVRVALEAVAEGEETAVRAALEQAAKRG